MMNIAENILKHSLRNVYFLTGTPCGGKTTAAQAISKKYGFVPFKENWHEENFAVWQSIIDERYQKNASKRQTVTDWEAYFGRTVEEFLADDNECNDYGEYLEYAIIELIKLSQNNIVISDIGFPMKLLTEIADYNKVACLLADPKLATCENYGNREDHREFLECILSLKDPQKKIAVQDERFRIGAEKAHAEAREYGMFSIVRDQDSTVENSLKLLETHFGLA